MTTNELEAIRARYHAATGIPHNCTLGNSLQDVPALLAEIERLRNELIEARSELDNYYNLSAEGVI